MSNRRILITKNIAILVTADEKETFLIIFNGNYMKDWDSLILQNTDLEITVT